MSALPDGFSVRIESEPAVRLCDICTSRCEGSRVATFIHDVPQSDVCLTCTRMLASLWAGYRIDRVDEARALTETAVVRA